MKRLKLLLLLLVFSCAEDYQEEFDNLNAQIAELKTIQSNISALNNSIESLKAAITTIETKLSDLENNTVVIHSLISTLTVNQNQIKSTLAELGVEVKNSQSTINEISVIDEEYLNALEQRLTKVVENLDNEQLVQQLNTINIEIEALKNQLKSLLDSRSDFYTGSPVIDTVGNLNFFHQIKGRLSRIDGDFVIRANKEMSTQKISEIASMIQYISGDLIIQTQSKDAPAAVFDNLEIIDGNLLIHQVGDIHFPKLKSVNNLVISNQYKNSITSIEFPLLEDINSFSTGPLRLAVNYFSNANHTIDLEDLSSLNLESLESYPNSLNIQMAKNSSLNLKKLESIETTPKSPVRTLRIDGPELIELDVFKTGRYAEFKDVPSISLPLYEGHLRIFSGVESVSAKISDFTIASNNDLEILDLFSINKDLELDTSDISDLEELTFDGVASEVKMVSNLDLGTINLRGRIKVVHLIGSGFKGDLNLYHINADIGRGGALKVKNNKNLNALNALNLNNLQVLEIQNNRDLTSIELPSLNSVHTKSAEVSILIGGLNNQNDLSATQIVEKEIDPNKPGNPEGEIISDSGLSHLKQYLQTALEKEGDIQVYFDRVDSFQQGENDPVSIEQITTENQGNLLLIKRVGEKATDGVKAKRGFVITPDGDNSVVNIRANGVFRQIFLPEGGSPKNLSKHIKKDIEDSRFFSVNDVTVDVFSGGIPQSIITSDLTDATLTQGNINAISTGSSRAAYIRLTIGNPSESHARIHTLYLVRTGVTLNFRPVIFGKKVNHARSLMRLSTSTTGKEIVTNLINAFPNAVTNDRTRGGGRISPTSPGNINFNIEPIRNTFNYLVSAYDQSDRFDGTPIEISSNIQFGSSNSDPTGGLKSIKATTMRGNGIVITLESDIPGATTSVIGQPPFIVSRSRRPNPVDQSADNIVFVTPGETVELLSKGDFGGRQYLLSPERTRTGVDSDLNDSESFILYKLDWIE